MWGIKELGSKRLPTMKISFLIAPFLDVILVCQILIQYPFERICLRLRRLTMFLSVQDLANCWIWASR